MSSVTVNRIRDLELFRGCRRSQLARIDEIGFTIDVAPGRVLLVEGDLGSQFFVLLNGLVEVHSSSVSAQLGAGSWFGAEALLNDVREPATVCTRVVSQLIVYSRRELQMVVGIAPSVGTRLLAPRVRRGQSSRVSGIPGTPLSRTVRAGHTARV
jgi:CRP-like cAMP-binding protein